MTEPTRLPKRALDSKTGFQSCSTISKIDWRRNRYTQADIVRAAWGLCLSACCDSKDICYLITLSGRDLPLQDIETSPGPTLNTIPVRLFIQPDQSVEDYLNRVQQDAIEMINHQLLGLAEIKRLDDACRQASTAGSLLVIQHNHEDDGEVNLEDHGLRELKDFYTMDYPLPLRMSCTIQEEGVHLRSFVRYKSMFRASDAVSPKTFP